VIASGDPREQVIAWLADLGPRWGLPEDSCRVHGHLYLSDRAATATELSDALGLESERIDAALRWLVEAGLAQTTPGGAWRTDPDPWQLLTTALAYRRTQELEPARRLLAAATREVSGDVVLSRQVGRLRDLVEDLAAIDAGAQHLSPATLRRLTGIGARFGRLLGSKRRE
jgi:DNA-binding transcriptional regulator GbsR (MarR family)